MAKGSTHLYARISTDIMPPWQSKFTVTNDSQHHIHLTWNKSLKLTTRQWLSKFLNAVKCMSLNPCSSQDHVHM